MLIPPAREYTQPRVLTEEEHNRLLEAVRGEIRDSAAIELLLQTGMRLSELAGLTLQDIELPARINSDERSIDIVHILGRGRKTRTVTLSWKACRAVRGYLQIRPNATTPRLFMTMFGAGMSPRAIQYCVGKYLKQTNIPYASVLTLRHTFATHMVKKGTKLDVVRQALVHSDLVTVHGGSQARERELESPYGRVAIVARGDSGLPPARGPGVRRLPGKPDHPAPESGHDLTF